MRKKYGTTWWGQQWLNALKHIDYSNRLPRGRNYANKGAVTHIEVKGSHIDAKVKGSRPRPYKVSLDIPVFSSAERLKIISLISEDPLFLSKLLNRNLPPSLDQACTEMGIDLFPKAWEDIKGKCSCPDWAVPCKHLAAVLYLIANEIDQDPFMVFELHGFDLVKGLEGIGFSVGEGKEIEIKQLDTLQSSAIEERVEDFQIHQAQLRELDFSKLPNLKDDLLQLLSDNPVFSHQNNYKKIIQKAYSNISKNVLKWQKASIQEASIDEPKLFSAEELELTLDSELDFHSLQLRDHQGKILLEFNKMVELLDWIHTVPSNYWPQLHPHLQSLQLALQFASRLAITGGYIPQMIQLSAKRYRMRWIPAMLNMTIHATTNRFAEILPCDFLFYKGTSGYFQPIISDRVQSLLFVFLDYFVQSFSKLPPKILEEDIGGLFFNGESSAFPHAIPGAIQLWLNSFYIAETELIPIIQVSEPEDKDQFEVGLAMEEKDKALASPIPFSALFEDDTFQNHRFALLRNLTLLADHFPQLSTLISSKGQEKLYFGSQEFVRILFQMLPVIKLFGIKVLMPKGLRKIIRPQLSLSLDAEGQGETLSFLSLEEMIRFDWQIALGDQFLSREAFREMVAQYRGIVKLNDAYAYFDEKEIASLLEKIENPPDLSANQLLQAALSESYDGAKIKLSKSMQKLLRKLLGEEAVAPPQGLLATLRPYQQRGYEWLYKNSRLGFGSIIADDMGLGKTLQVICTLLKFKEEGKLAKQQALVIVPTTLLTNWDNELKKFAPNLSAHIYHGSNRDIQEANDADILITSYGVARSESTLLAKRKWAVVIIDEAQQIKNPATAQSKAIKKMKAPVKIAMSGTPVENRLSEYWSIFDFTNKTYLNTLRNFTTEFAQPIEIDRDQGKLEQFQKITSPFILRRLKSDKSIIKDLPDKIKQDVFCSLTQAQAALYQNVINTTMKAVESADGIERKGLVLKLITALKQVCNHPYQFLKKGKDDAALSGKCQSLMELIPQVLEQGERMLIFTQYQEMGKLLAKILLEATDMEIPFLYGGTSRKQRDEMVDAFQNGKAPPILLLSLKAAGTGLNLTAANHVVHYDLWWNPAVENQATDRAYRIGQQKNVHVHRFITEGTFEEKINEMIQSKQELADMAVATGEKWIGEFSNKELRELVELG